MGYIGNEQRWRGLIEVDWLGQYAKTWAAFNAWYRNNFTLDSDRDIINAIKKDGGYICSKIENSLSGDSSVQKSFQSDVADLHRSLSDTVIKSKCQWISFEEIEDYQHAKPIEEKKNTISYKIQINTAERKRIVTVTKSNGTQIFCDTIRRREENSLDTQQFPSLSKAQERTLEGFLKESAPMHNLLYDGIDHLEIGSFKFINNANLIARAIIEILYQLRNALFHGEITPDSKTQTVYQPAYLILKSIIPKE